MLCQTCTTYRPLPSSGLPETSLFTQEKSQLCGLVEKKLKNWKRDMRQDTVTSASAERERTIKIAIAWKEKD